VTAAAPSPLWFLDRSTGEVTLLLLSAVVILGIVRSALPGSMPLLLEGLHANLALLAVAFGIMHVLAAILDPYAQLGLVDVLVPFWSAYRKAWLAMGVLSAYMVGLTVVISWPARRLPRRLWSWLHRALYVGWGLALMHSLATGSDAGNPVFLILDLLAVAGVVVAFLAYRVTEGRRDSPRLWGGLAAVAVMAVLGFGWWAATGPLQPGWARTSGTPPGLLRSP